MTYHDGYRYQVGMLWADDDSSLPNNYFSALVQLKSLERRLERTPDLRTSYAQTIKDDFDKGYIVKVDKSDCFKVENPREWYLPHHPVLHPHKPGKVRRVLNGAAKFHGVSLNNALLTGPDLLQTLIHVLMRFRQHPYAVSADIEGMFLQVGVIPQDRPSLCFLWREEPKPIPKLDTKTDEKLLAAEVENSHVLGLKWNHRLDTLVVSRGTSPDLNRTVTQRVF